ncbi:MAG: HAD-IIIC family phosphatase [Magnetococcales bacterium]|nr:HAD-IIIC family phosphatase [Magnetococcales bacterium]
MVLRLRLVADFTVDTLAAMLRNDGAEPTLEVTIAPFGRVVPELMALASRDAADAPATDPVLVWTRPEGIIGIYHQALEGQPFEIPALLEEVDRFADQLLAVAARGSTVLMAAWTRPAHHRGLGLLDWQPGMGLRYALTAMNLRLAQRLAEHPGCHLLDTERWVSTAGPRSLNIKRWYLSKVWYAGEVFQIATAEIKAALATLQGCGRKLLILDLDNTLWGGVVGDDGMEGLVLGGHDPMGEAFVDFQRTIKALSRRGILLAVVSKNEETVALHAMDNHPEMVLRREDLAAWRINWQDKAANIRDLVAELNLGLQSCVFLDDSPFERARVRETLPEVLVPELPESPLLLVPMLEALTCFDPRSLTPEDRQRQQMYQAERHRRVAQGQSGDLHAWLHGLGMTVTALDLNAVDLARAAQLLNKTNQMNLITRRLAEAELLAWCREDQRHFWTFRIGDRFGDAGLSALVSVEIPGKGESVAHLVDFVVSCRVFERGVEESLLAFSVAWIRERYGHVVRLEARFLPTAKNLPCLRFFRERSGFEEQGPGNGNGAQAVFVWQLERPYPLPSHITLQWAGTP